jgi:tRNA-Thr(GGU) m(6)t(6)A37 methyltransferase TsaA
MIQDKQAAKDSKYLLFPIGVVRSSLRSLEECPKQGHEGGADAWLEIDPAFAGAADGLSAGQDILILTWLDKGRRDQLKVHPRGNPNAPLRGVFATRSPDRPNPIGLHRVTMLEIDNTGRLRVRPLEALDGTPIIDIKPVLVGQEEG